MKLEDLVVEQNKRYKYPGDWVVRVYVEKPWLFKPRFNRHQSVIAFPAISGFGIGFKIEKEDSNTHLPYQLPAERIYNHIKVNWVEGDKALAITAIRLIQTYLKGYYDYK